MAAQREFDGRLEEAELVAGVVALAFEAVGVDRAAAQQVLEGVGELDFAARARVDRLQRVEDLGRQDVAADDGQVGRRLGRLGLLDQVADAVDAVVRCRCA